MSNSELSPELRQLVAESVAELGLVIRAKLGVDAYRRIESIRRSMSRLRGAPTARVHRILSARFRELSNLSYSQRFEIARGFVLMLELMNACENAYRNIRIQSRRFSSPRHKPDSIIYVLTAHPTEARSPESIWVFHQIQRILTDNLVGRGKTAELRHWLELAWQTPIFRAQKPTVRDEAEHVYSTVLSQEILKALLAVGRELCPVYVRSWVGGDKDGHPGVNQKIFVESLELSRGRLLSFAHQRVRQIRQAAAAVGARRVLSACDRLEASIRRLERIEHADARRILQMRSALRNLTREYECMVHSIHPALKELHQLVRVFPALVVPLEFRESSSMLEEGSVAIAGMLSRLRAISKGGDPRWYVRGFIVSMTKSVKDLRQAAKLVTQELGGLKLPVIPLLEQAETLDQGPQIVDGFLKSRAIRSAVKRHWGGHLEVMVGYSDSAKEGGVLPSRLAIARAMHQLDRKILSAGPTPIFFQGSGGSVDRGGGTVQEQTAWWPQGALRNYKVTLQGEMVERSLASPEIARGQLERIVQSAGGPAIRAIPSSPDLDRFVQLVARSYRAKVHDPDFLKVIKFATPYRVLDALRIGSRPTARSKGISVESLRAIPWILCWTQTRILFPVWWGVGTAWAFSDSGEKKRIAQLYPDHPVFATYVRALGFTLAKVELPVWRIYLEQSGLSRSAIRRNFEEFSNELALSLRFYQAVTGSSQLLAHRPWLGESIRLRSPMIHPLNLLQLVALETRDLELLRLTVTGISAGMMTTG